MTTGRPERQRGGGTTTPGGITLEAAMDILVPDVIEPLTRRAQPADVWRMKELFRRYPWLMRFLIGTVMTGAEIGFDTIPLSDRVHRLGAGILEHVPITLERYFTRLEFQRPDGVREPTFVDIPDVLWRYFRGVNLQVPESLRSVFNTARQMFGEEGGNVSSNFIQLTPDQRRNIEARMREIGVMVAAARTNLQTHPDDHALRDALRDAEALEQKARHLIDHADREDLERIGDLDQIRFQQLLALYQPALSVKHALRVGLTGAVDGGVRLGQLYREHRDEYEARHPEIAARRDRREQQRQEFDARQEPRQGNGALRFLRQLFTGRS